MKCLEVSEDKSSLSSHANDNDVTHKYTESALQPCEHLFLYMELTTVARIPVMHMYMCSIIILWP